MPDAYWLSFVDPAKSAPPGEQVPGGGGFLGVAIVTADSALLAVDRAWELGVNPGGEVQIFGPFPSVTIRDADLNRLLTAAETDAVNEYTNAEQCGEHSRDDGDGFCVCLKPPGHEPPHACEHGDWSAGP